MQFFSKGYALCTNSAEYELNAILFHEIVQVAYLYKLACSMFSENVSRLKKLEYLNLALNNVELIENLEGEFSKTVYIYIYIYMQLFTDNIVSFRSLYQTKQQ